MRYIYKYPLCHRGTFEQVSLTLPKGAQIVHAAVQDKIVTMWALVPHTAEGETRIFQVLPTGGFINEESSKHIATFFDSTPIGEYVWHLFEVT